MYVVCDTTGSKALLEQCNIIKIFLCLVLLHFYKNKITGLIKKKVKFIKAPKSAMYIKLLGLDAWNTATKQHLIQ